MLLSVLSISNSSISGSEATVCETVQAAGNGGLFLLYLRVGWNAPFWTGTQGVLHDAADRLETRYGLAISGKCVGQGEFV